MSDQSIVPGLPPPPPQMIADIAYGMEEPVDIAFRYGYTASQFALLEQHAGFVQAVMSVRTELERGGHTVKVKARWMAEQLLEQLYYRAAHPAAPSSLVIDTIKIASKLGDLEPKLGGPAAGSGMSGTSVQIIFTGERKAEVTIGGTTEAAADTQRVFDLPPAVDTEAKAPAPQVDEDDE